MILNLVLNILHESNDNKLGYDFEYIRKLEKEREKILKFLKKDKEKESSDKIKLTLTN